MWAPLYVIVPQKGCDSRVSTFSSWPLDSVIRSPSCSKPFKEEYVAMMLPVGSCLHKLSMAQVLAPMAAQCSLSVAIKDFPSILEEKVQTMVQKLQTESLPKIKAIKEESEVCLGCENQLLTQWLRKIDLVICEAEDILDEYQYKRLKQQVLWKQHTYVRSFYSYIYHALYKSRVEAVLKLLDRISSTVDDFIWVYSSDAWANSRRAAHAHACIVTTSELIEQVFGRDKEVEHVAKLLTSPAKRKPISDDEDEQNFQVLPIIGVGGVGKTVLAKSLFNHPKIIKHFHPRMWVHVPEDFDEVRITTRMIQLASSADQERPDNKNLDQLQKLLSEHIKDEVFARPG